MLGRGPPARRPLPVTGGAVVVDGDTLRLADGRRVRLPDVDAPETGRPFAAEATALARTFIAGEDWTLVASATRTDRYGRLLCDVRVADRSLSAALVEAGLAWVRDTGHPALVSLQADAVRSRRGMHRGLDRIEGGPWLVSARRFHRGDCRWVRAVARHLPVETCVASLLERGLAPCRSCLPWPP